MKTYVMIYPELTPKIHDVLSKLPTNLRSKKISFMLSQLENIINEDGTITISSPQSIQNIQSKDNATIKSQEQPMLEEVFLGGNNIPKSESSDGNGYNPKSLQLKGDFEEI